MDGFNSFMLFFFLIYLPSLVFHQNFPCKQNRDRLNNTPLHSLNQELYFMNLKEKKEREEISSETLVAKVFLLLYDISFVLSLFFFLLDKT